MLLNQTKPNQSFISFQLFLSSANLQAIILYK